jgi:hypothetical protein
MRPEPIGEVNKASFDKGDEQKEEVRLKQRVGGPHGRGFLRHVGDL